MLRWWCLGDGGELGRIRVLMVIEIVKQWPQSRRGKSVLKYMREVMGREGEREREECIEIHALGNPVNDARGNTM